MSVGRKSNEKRDVIPRWRHSQDIAKFAEAVSPQKVEPTSITTGIERVPLEILSEFSDSKKPLVWAEALSAALATRDFDDALAIIDARKGVDLSHFALLEGTADEDYIKRLRLNPDTQLPTELEDEVITQASQMRAAREAIRIYDSNALAWLDLARAHAINGDLERAERGIWSALRFDPDSRWVVRAAARFFIHHGKKDTAVDVIERAESYRHDPWLVSAHIAVSHAIGQTSELVRRARSLFDDDNFRPRHVSELGMALATLEIESSSRSRAVNRIAKRSLRDPTENAVAQARWIESIWGKALGANDAAQHVQNAFEARAKDLEKTMQWEAATKETFHWLCDQPFSSRPAIDGSYLAATFLQDYELAERFAEIGYRANPKDPMVKNNYAVALAERGKLPKARHVFGALGDPHNEGFDETYRATEGLLRYREGRVDAARECYEKSRVAFEAAGDHRSTLLSLVFQTEEELRLNQHDEALKLFDIGERVAKQADSRELAAMLKKHREKVEQFARDRRPPLPSQASR